MQIQVDPLTGPEIAALLREHLDEMHRISPPESVHALDLDRLRTPEVTFWSAWSDGELLGCIALKQLDRGHGEIKSMRTSVRHQRRGVASALLRHLLEEAQRRGYRQLSLETGTQPEFSAARTLYARYGFQTCGPFAQYAEDPHSAFMTRMLQPARQAPHAREQAR
ncbi:GNAT family N-acetyltransferase [Marilutibacter alkalisoli]|uniref:GNAT family N-acetyltransferase n=1 Tax=Marilutibacter alkalisoli TaxID=2591633 RepID=A0A514BPB6_9GAMM|nr:GNAT family N-acetyltransferase [Lysobacter alkalisoli]QDH69222.1 GNAT family N-acetyltransferase [Lysobacter alkalisoli]